MAIGAGLATKVTWLPPGSWVDANTGVVTTVAESDPAHMHTSAYHLSEVPLWYAAGAVIPYIPLRSMASSVGNAAKQYTFLGFKVCVCVRVTVPGPRSLPKCALHIGGSLVSPPELDLVGGGGTRAPGSGCWMCVSCP
jgi:hypothetical protein